MTSAGVTGDICIGIDYTDANLRVSYVDRNGPQQLARSRKPLMLSIMLDPHRNISSIGVGFPSLLRSIGGGTTFQVGDKLLTAEDVVVEQLTAIRLALERETGKTCGVTVVAVPAAFSQKRRKALIECCDRAGLQNVSLIDACTAVALRYSGDQQSSSTLLVYHLGYGECEFCLARVARGRIRVLEMGTDTGASGELFDALLMEEIILALREENIFLGLKQFAPEQWLIFRNMAAAACAALGQRRTAGIRIPPELVGDGDWLNVQLSSEEFGERIRPVVEGSLDAIKDMLERNELAFSTLNAVVAAGSVAKRYPVAELLHDWAGDRLSLGRADVVAGGSALYAGELADRNLGPSVEDGTHSAAPVFSTYDEAAATREGSEDSDSTITPVRRVYRDPSSSAKPLHSTERPKIDDAVSLIQSGQYKDASEVLDSIERDVQALRQIVESKEPTGPRRLIAQGREILDARLFSEAVAMSHKAYGLAADDAEVFSGMMEIHAEAGSAMNSPEQYEDAIRILRCAHSHDQTDPMIHKAIARRHYLHAAAMRERNNVSEALDAIRQALKFDPKDEEANQLLKELTAVAG